MKRKAPQRVIVIPVTKRTEIHVSERSLCANATENIFIVKGFGKL
jgi:hypothetical protein